MSDRHTLYINATWIFGWVRTRQNIAQQLTFYSCLLFFEVIEFCKLASLLSALEVVKVSAISCKMGETKSKLSSRLNTSNWLFQLG